MENIAKSTSYGCYLDCDFETAKYPDDKTHIVGLLAEYVYDLEQRILHYDERYIKLWNEIETLRECVSKEFDQEQQISDLEAKLAKNKKWLASNEGFLENQQLKQQLHDLPKKIVEEIRDDMSKKIMEKQIKWGDNTQIGFICNAINECLDTILEKFGGKDESNND